MNTSQPSAIRPRLICLSAATGITLYAILILRAESQMAVGILLAIGAAIVIIGARLDITAKVGSLFLRHEQLTDVLALAGLAAITICFSQDHYVLFMVATVMLYMVACLGLNIQLGLAGVANFSGASFFFWGWLLHFSGPAHPYLAAARGRYPGRRSLRGDNRISSDSSGLANQRPLCCTRDHRVCPFVQNVPGCQ